MLTGYLDCRAKTNLNPSFFHLLISGRYIMVSKSGSVDGLVLRNSRRHLVVRLHLRRTLPPEASLPRPIWNGSAEQDLRHHRHAQRGGLAGEGRRDAEQLSSLSVKRLGTSCSGNGWPCQGSHIGKFTLLVFCSFIVQSFTHYDVSTLLDVTSWYYSKSHSWDIIQCLNKHLCDVID